MVNGIKWKELREIRKMGEQGILPGGAIMALLGVQTGIVDASGNPVRLVKQEETDEKAPAVGFRFEEGEPD